MVLNNIKSIRKDRGFTIVELLVVIVVIGILAAITVVSYTGVTNKANQAAAKQNASSVAAAADASFAENNGVYPIYTNLSAGTVKLPSNVSVIITTPAVGTPAAITYVRVAGGYCIQYWDVVAPGIATYATAGTGAACFS